MSCQWLVDRGVCNWALTTDHRQLTTEVTREYRTSDQETFAGAAEGLS
jgi:hypothetical protein